MIVVKVAMKMAISVSSPSVTLLAQERHFDLKLDAVLISLVSVGITHFNNGR